MKIRSTHIDLVDSQDVCPLTFQERMELQLEMIRDHQYLTQRATLEEAVFTWVSEGWAKRFADHYPTKK